MVVLHMKKLQIWGMFFYGFIAASMLNSFKDGVLEEGLFSNIQIVRLVGVVASLVTAYVTYWQLIKAKRE